jgi:hypothetical protein
MNRTTAVLLPALALAAVLGFAQARSKRPAGRQKLEGRKSQTVRLHIDGFMKSKSGAT